MDDFISTFGDKDSIKLGADKTGNGPNDSFGVWLKNAHNIAPIWASCIVAILVKENIAGWRKEGSSILFHIK